MEKIEPTTKRWADALKEIQAAYPHRWEVVQSGISYKLYTLVQRVAMVIARDPESPQYLNTDTPSDDILRYLREKYGDLFSDDGLLEEIARDYKVIYEERNDLLNAREQTRWATLVDHVTALIFRTVLALTIAAVVLGTAYLAKRWDIPLPMLRGFP